MNKVKIKEKKHTFEPMLSICIPTYNYDIRNLVQILVQQAKLIEIPIEILVIDDQSNDEFQKINQEIARLEFVKYKILAKNLRHSKIRNLFTSFASYDYLLFLDADTLPVKDDFLSNYIKSTHPRSVIYGGISYVSKKPPKKYLLRWKYGQKRESIPLIDRKSDPYHAFISMNFVIPKLILQQFPFDENIPQYGHEDTLLAFRLMQNNIPIVHIDNPVYHINLDSSKKFLQKIESSVASLIFIRSQTSNDFNQMVRLLQMGCTIQRKHLTWFVKTLFAISKPLLRWNLLSNYPIIYGLDFYKLGYLLKICAAKNINLCSD